MSKKEFIPDWTKTPPLPGSYRSIIKMGRQDQITVPSDSHFRQLRKDLQLDESLFKDKRDGNQPLGEVPPSNLDPTFLNEIRAIVGEENLQVDDYNRVKYSYGQLSEEVVNLKRGILHEVTGAVVHPRDKFDVLKIVKLCDEKKIPIYVYSGGSSVNQGFLPEKEGITLVMGTHMNKVLEVNEKNATCRVQAGCMGPQLEEALNNAPKRFHTQHRYTNGHFPESFEISSVGGWVLTLGSGQASTYYGEPYNLVLAMEMITPRGIIRTRDFVSSATGPRVVDILKGSEGVFGVLVEVTIKIFRYMPENRKYFSYIFPDFNKVVEAGREICQGQFGLPAIFRISDGLETESAFQLHPQPPLIAWVLEKVLHLQSGKRCLCMGTIEGDADYTKLVRCKIAQIAKKYGGFSTGAGPEKKWEQGRFTFSMIIEALSDYDIILSSVETSVRWDNLHHIHDTVLEYAHAIPGTTCFSHMSHFYPQGSNLYFIFGVKGSVQDYVNYRTGLIDAMVKAGGSPSHHHGVGRLMQPWIEEYLGSEEMEVLRALKRHFDPKGIMNPGSQLGLAKPNGMGK